MDKLLAEKEVPVHYRSLEVALVFIRWEQEGRLLPLPVQHQKIDRYVIDWYQNAYGDKAEFPTYFGKRLVLIRGCAYSVHLIGFKPECPLQPELGLSNALIKQLTENEKSSLLATLGNYYRDENLIRDSMHQWGLWSTSLSGNLIKTAWSSLNVMATGFRPDDCSQIVYDGLQAVEKFLKGLYCLFHLDAGEAILKKKFSHGIVKIYDALVVIRPELESVAEPISTLSKYSPQVRYVRDHSFSLVDAVTFSDQVHTVCSLTSKILVDSIPDELSFRNADLHRIQE